MWQAPLPAEASHWPWIFLFVLMISILWSIDTSNVLKQAYPILLGGVSGQGIKEEL